MTCETVRIGDGVAIVCSRVRPRRRQCQVRGCHRPGVRQCDFETAPGKTCDKYLCVPCAVAIGPGRDHCPDHPAKPMRPGSPKPVQLGLFPLAVVPP